MISNKQKVKGKKVYKTRVKKGDEVMIRSGKYKGHTGKVLQVHPALNQVTVEGINIVKRHKKPTRVSPQGGIIEITKPIWVSKIGLLDSSSKRPSRIGYKFSKDGSRRRILQSSGKETK